MKESKRLSKLNYKINETAFDKGVEVSRENDSINDFAKSIQPNFLGNKQPKWNNSVSIKNENFNFENHVKFNLRFTRSN